MDKMNVPLVNLKRMHEELKDEIMDAIEGVYDKCNFILGDEVEKFENEFAEYVGCKHAIGVSSGLDALRIAMKAVGVKSGDKVVMQNNTFIATALAALDVGAELILIDCKTDCQAVDPSYDLKRSEAKFFVPVHMTGASFDFDCIDKSLSDIRIVEDACQSHGCKYKGKRVGSIGDIACFSFYPGKNLGSVGDAGMITTNNKALADFCRCYRHYGQDGKYNHVIAGGNNRMDTIAAAALRVKLKYLDSWNERRMSIAMRYDQELFSISRKGFYLRTLPEDFNSTHVSHLYQVYVCRVGGMYSSFNVCQRKTSEWRNEIVLALNSAGIGAGIHYPNTVYDSLYNDERVNMATNEFYSKSKDELEDCCSTSKKLASGNISLPCCPYMTDEEQDYVIDKVKEIMDEHV